MPKLSELEHIMKPSADHLQAGILLLFDDGIGREKIAQTYKMRLPAVTHILIENGRDISSAISTNIAASTHETGRAVSLQLMQSINRRYLKKLFLEHARQGRIPPNMSEAAALAKYSELGISI